MIAEHLEILKDDLKELTEKVAIIKGYVRDLEPYLKELKETVKAIEEMTDEE